MYPTDTPEAPIVVELCPTLEDSYTVVLSGAQNSTTPLGRVVFNGSAATSQDRVVFVNDPRMVSTVEDLKGNEPPHGVDIDLRGADQKAITEAIDFLRATLTGISKERRGSIRSN